MGIYTNDLQLFISAKFNETLLVKILQELYCVNDVSIKSIKFNSDSKKGDSYLSTVTRLIVEANGQNTGDEEPNVNINLPLIAKALPNNESRRKTFRSLDFFRNEVIFYNKIWPAMNEFQKSKNSSFMFEAIPLCVSAIADGTNDYVLLEDLSYKNYKTVSRGRCLDLKHAELVLQLFAKFHALGLAFKNQKPKEFELAAATLEETYFSEKFRGWYSNFQNQNLLPVILDAVEKQLPALYLNKLKETISMDFYGKLIECCKNKGPLAVITHGDTWIPNFLFKYNEDGNPIDAFIIDFQLTRYASPILDLTFFLYSCTESFLQTEYWDLLIVKYYETFMNSLDQLGCSSKLFSLDDLKAEIKKYAIFGIGMSMEAIVMSLLDDEETADLDTIEGEFVPLETIWRVYPFKSEEKRQRIADMIKHAVDNNFL